MSPSPRSSGERRDGRTVAIVQARTGSTRLPGKVLRPILGQPMIHRVMTRAARASTLDAVVLATTTLPEDDALAGLAQAAGWPVTRGSPTDLLDRYLQAAREHEAEVVVRITSDCPLIDPEVIDRVVEAFRAAEVDYASNTLEPRTYPRGLDVEVVSLAALEQAGREDSNPAWREHATPYLYRHPERFRLLRVPFERDESRERWSVDTPEDETVVRRLYEALGRDDFGWLEALAVAKAHPEWSRGNRDIEQKAVPPA
ncbi:MAG TPA: glycosyltransferase family protein [Candidatus Limnocylindrales bacterium]|nr:glycosyltransferase family protein [Candidatus Limnocylindrales bacterium]